MKTTFCQPRFTGQRFDEHTLPVEVARDLAAYEALVIDLAKHLYKLENPKRERAPKGFAANFRLDIQEIGDGSTKPLLAVVMSGMLALSNSEPSHFERARDLIAECVAAPEGRLPEHFPKELLSHFNQFGRSLRDGEALELPLATSGNAVLTPERRKKLVLAASEEYEREVELQGYIGEVDWEKSTFRLRLADNSTMDVPLLPSFHDEARAYGGRSRHWVIVKGVGTFNAWDRLKRILSAESSEVVKNVVIANRLDELAQLAPGWFEGAGLAPDKDRLSQFAEQLTASYPDGLVLPAIFPTQDGNLLLEWDAVGDPSLDVRLADLLASYHAFDDDGADIERDFRLDGEQGWSELHAFLSANIRKRQA